MFHIRRLYYDESTEIQQYLTQVSNILRTQFPRLITDELDQIFKQFHNPLQIGMKTLLFIAEDSHHTVRGCAIVLHELTVNFFYLDFIAVKPGTGGKGIGGALYQRIQEEARAFETLGILFDCYSDTKDFPDPALIEENQKRLRFYEEFGVFPIINNAYHEPLNANSYPVLLLYDDLGITRPISRDLIRVIVRIILERRYGAISPVQYIERIVASFQNDPIQLREPCYIKPVKLMKTTSERQNLIQSSQKIAICISDMHTEFAVPSKGYYEVPSRIGAIWDNLRKSSIFSVLRPREYPEEWISAVHSREYLSFLKSISKSIPPHKTIYPVVFPLRNRSRAPIHLVDRAGYFCFDNTTPLTHNIYSIASRAVDCALTCAENIVHSKQLAYALVRPPGHHAESNVFGGYCFLNNTAITAHYLSQNGRVAVLDIDYHHGNGTQEIFYHRNDVLTISLHADPEFEYPYFTGFADEIGEGEGESFNLNIPLPKGIDGTHYIQKLQQAMDRIRSFSPKYLVIALGLDTAKKDPSGMFLLNLTDFHQIGHMIGQFHLPTVIIQEGGYHIPSIGKNARSFFSGLYTGFYN